jgi:pimeloyl-ACP methyl ester carboxylesterase
MLAAFHGDLIRRAVVCAAGPGSDHWTPPTPRAIQIFSSSAGLNSHAVQYEILFTPDHGGRRAAHQFAADLRLWKYPDGGISKAQFDAQKLADVEYYASQGDGIWDQLPGIHNKVLVVCGAEDILVRRQNCELLADNIVGAELLLYPARHGFNVQYGERVAADITRFLR